MHDLLLQLAQTSAIEQYKWILMALGLAFGFYMAWTIGANDVANAMGTSVGSGALTLKRAIIVAGILEFAGAVLVGQHVTGAIREDILPFEAFAATPDDYVFGMLASLLAAATWLLVATYFGLPVSTTHTIVGAVVGFGIVVLPDWGFSTDPKQSIAWAKMGKIVASWLVSPALSGSIAFFVFIIIQRRILYQRDLVTAARKMAPYFVFAVFFVITLVTLWKGLKPLKMDFSFWQAIGLASILSVGASFASIPLIRRIRVERESEDDPSAQNPMVSEELERLESRVRKLAVVATGDVQDGVETLKKQIAKLKERVSDSASPRGSRWGTPELRTVERIFVYLQILSACAVAFAHGANDVANAVGPLSGVIHVLQKGVVSATTQLDPLLGLGILAVGGVGIVLGLATWGRRVIETVGRKITELTPTRGFSAEFGAAVTILLASRFALPVSTTHTLVGAVLGVGLARGVSALNLRVIVDILISWVVTLPAGALLSIVFYYTLKAIF
ncbi:MAG: inorganic phosphate transporter [Planctomycetota bacterium]|nr:inorganic phosphate transporter [Planctomycetota bacterium]